MGKRSARISPPIPATEESGDDYFMKIRQSVGGALVITLASLWFMLPKGARGDVQEAITYLEGKQQNSWITMALAASGKNPSVEYLKTANTESALSLEAPILALVAAGKDPRTFPNTDFVAALKGFVAGGQIGDVGLVNDDIFGVLALIAGGDPETSAEVQASLAFLLANQNTDGGWSYGVGGSSDTNTTAAGIMALRAAGKAISDANIQKAIAYLKAAQNSDAGFPYNPKSPYGTSSDASSGAWVVSAIYALGESPNSWSKGGATPLSHLASLQKSGGFFINQEGAGETSFTPTETAYALIALLGKWYPITRTLADAPLAEYKIQNETAIICEGEVRAWNALEIVKNAAGTCGITYEIEETSFGPYLKKINTDVAEGMKGWLYAVNMEMPSVGAADYALQDGDDVLWRYGNWEDVTFGEKIETSIPLEVTISGEGSPSGGGGGGGGSAPEVAFVIAASDGKTPAFSFGSAKTGDALEKTIKLTNSGQKPLHIESVVQGDSLFRDNLKVEGEGWRKFELNLASNEEKDAKVEVQIPASYAGRGTKSGTLTFWGVAE